MAIIRWSPLRGIDRFFDEDFELDFPVIPGISRLMGQGLNLYETEEAVVAEAALPGIPEDKIDVTLDDGVVRITGSREVREEEKGKRRSIMNYLSSAYNYAFRLPQGVALDKEPEIILDNGVLRIKFPKIETKPPKKFKVSKAKQLKVA